MTRSRNVRTALLAALFSQTALVAAAEMRPTLSFGGVPGLIDMPSGETLEDGTFAVTGANFGPVTRTTLTFQIAPRLTGSFRYQSIRDWGDPLYPTYNDRSFDLRFLVLKESKYLPSVSVGVQDFIGTGIYSAEYVAATKTFGDRVKVTAGLGWGRFGSYNSIGAPFGDRPAIDFGQGGKPSYDHWFKGPMAAFGGIEWKVNDHWTVKAEYSSDAYTEESGNRGAFDRKSPFNFGVEYQKGDMFRAGLYSLYGSEVGFAFNLVLDPKSRPSIGVLGPAPAAVGTRPSRSADPEAYDGGWVTQPDAAGLLHKNLAKRLEADGIIIESMHYTAGTVELRVRNTRIDSEPQAIGRVARALSQVMPASVETFEIVPVIHGVGVSKVTVRRSDLEALEFAPANDQALRDKVTLTAAGPAPDGSFRPEGLYPKFTWKLLPAIRVSEPLRGDIGLRFSASYDLRPGLVLSTSIYKRVADNFDKITHVEAPSVLPHVRSDVGDYNRNGDPAVERLTLAWYAKPADNLYSRMTFGYLERMHAGVSGELLWKPVDSRLALGAELNYTKQRDTNGGFGFGEYDYSIVTGHVSAYYDFGQGYLGQLDVGRYLAGDMGATLSVDREFANGWRFGAFATLTDVSADEFGEGSFDKGIRLTMPLNWLLMQPSRTEMSTTIRPLQRDGGARLDVDGRLYDSIRDYHGGQLDTEWGRVWR